MPRALPGEVGSRHHPRRHIALRHGRLHRPVALLARGGTDRNVGETAREGRVGKQLFRRIDGARREQVHLAGERHVGEERRRHARRRSHRPAKQLRRAVLVELIVFGAGHGPVHRLLEHAAGQVPQPPRELAVIVIAGFGLRRLRDRTFCRGGDGESGRQHLGLGAARRAHAALGPDACEDEAARRRGAGSHADDVARAEDEPGSMHANEVLARGQQRQRAPAVDSRRAGHRTSTHRRHDGSRDGGARDITDDADDRSGGRPFERTRRGQTPSDRRGGCGRLRLGGHTCRQADRRHRYDDSDSSGHGAHPHRTPQTGPGNGPVDARLTDSRPRRPRHA
jgi:hypothetical protein